MGNPPSYSSRLSQISSGLEESLVSSSNPKKHLPLFEKLDDYQKDAVLFAVPQTGCALFFEQGTGKTWIALGILEYLNLETALFVVPLTNLRTTWAKTIREQLPQYTVCFNWTEFKLATGKRILLVNYEAMPSIIKKAQKFKFDLVVFDESQKLKSRSSRISRYARRFRHHDRRVALSGTPMDKSPIDVWAQLRFVNHKVLGEKWSTFADEFCRRGGFMNKKWIFCNGKTESGKEDPDIPNKLPEFLARVSSCCLRVEKSDVLGTPKPKIRLVPVVLLGQQRLLYEKMDADMVARFEGSRIKADLVITRNVKLQQITGGALKDDEGETLQVGAAKARKLSAMVKIFNLKPPFVVFCKYTAEVDIIKKEMRKHFKRIGILTGKVKDRKNDLARTRIQQEFQGGQLDVLICQLRTGGVGIDLYAAHQVIFYSMNHSWIDFDQAVSRLDRRGQTKRVECFLLIAQNTIDEDILEAVKSKRSLTQVVLRRLKQRRTRHG
jgi:SNF2 family DNA or RNA helicase